jgi:hypothetical protein
MVCCDVLIFCSTQLIWLLPGSCALQTNNNNNNNIALLTYDAATFYYREQKRNIMPIRQ